MVDSENKYIGSASEMRRIRIQTQHCCCFCRKVPDEVVKQDTGKKFVHAKECCKCGRRVISYEPVGV